MGGGEETHGESHQGLPTITSPMPRAPGHGPPQLRSGVSTGFEVLWSLWSKKWSHQVRDTGFAPALSRLLAVSLGVWVGGRAEKGEKLLPRQSLRP